jgi:hypothetical protein
MEKYVLREGIEKAGLEGKNEGLEWKDEVTGCTEKAELEQLQYRNEERVLYKRKGEEDPYVGIQPRIQEGKSQSSTFKIKHVKCIHCCTSGTHTVYCTMHMCLLSAQFKNLK